jgi:hypothetical protein
MNPRGRVLAVVLGTATLITGCSGGANSSTVPPGWKGVGYQGVAIDVPQSWAVMPWRATCGVNTPTVFVGPGGPYGGIACPGLALGAMVELGATTPDLGRLWTTETINGLRVEVSTERSNEQGFILGRGLVSGPVTTTWVNVPGGVGSHAVAVYVSTGDTRRFPGGDPGMTQQIVSTIHRT